MKNTTCPLYNNNTRGCAEEFREIITIIVCKFDFCATENHIKCPFYLIINKIQPLCDFVKHCPMYFFVATYDFEGLMEMTSNYCCSKNCVNCARYKYKKKGTDPPYDLYPNGKKIK